MLQTENRVTPWVLAGRIFSIIGMSLAAAISILFFIGGFFLEGVLTLVGFIPFFLLIVVVEKYSAKHGLIGPPEPLPRGFHDDDDD
jgi:hypothetical protein